ncbi:GNAT family N-acetyltransferase [Robiginitalea sp. SC105]|uniref:GNAT family N-acetyltransferase n=1 Tax=Robiginitalea sp. SC105 TaxID=2762332 RepID=UPI00163B0D8A|nr:GNAT family N-acetyltransferase [Robiginitalea sp. SC105]MBC2838472.1 GNAT family N-acetyltransferase [Robiginitalea sp. SC105]
MDFVMIRIQEATSVKDFATIAGLADTIWREHYIPIIGKPQVDYMLEKFQSAAAIGAQSHSGSLYFLLLEDGEAAGYFAVENQGENLFLSKIYVLKSHRGRGLARAAMDRIRQLARQWGCQRIALTVNKDNTASIAAYQRMGFIKGEGTIKDIGDGFIMDDYRMTLDIQ